ncbi:MAG: hypothetical protein V4543_02195 [Bacteroidota bacterium]
MNTALPFSTFFRLLAKALLCIAACILLMPGSAHAQLDNSAFYDATPWQPEAEGKLYLNIKDMGYMQNNEYFGTGLDGYTLFGNQFSPGLSYYARPNMRIDAGVFLRKDFGNNNFAQIQPTLSLTVKYDSLTFIFGNLDGSLQHNLIQPMYNFEKVINNRLESGSQFLYKNRWFKGDLWVDWQATEYFGSNYHERIFGGLSVNAALINTPDWGLDIPFQFTAYHNGGQIDTSSAQQFTQMSSALGIGLEKRFGPGNWLKSIRTENYILGQNNNSLVIPHTWNNGGGLYANLLLKTKWLSIMGSLWYGHQYMNLKGGFLYQSLGNMYSATGPYIVEGKQLSGATLRNRNVIIIRLMRDFKIAEGITVTTRLEPVYQTDYAKWEYSYGVFVNFRTDFLLAALKKKQQ